MNKVTALIMWSILSVLIPTCCIATSQLQPEKNKLEQNKAFILNIIQTYSENISRFKNNFCKSGNPLSASTSVGSFARLSTAEFCKRRMQVFPGSIVNCYDCAGTWVTGTEKATHSAGGILMQEERVFDSWKINVGYNHGRRYSLDNIIITVTDLTGKNYVTLRYDDVENAFSKRKNIKYSIQDIRLPDTVSTEMVSVKQSPAIKISHNELITMINRAYQNFPYRLYDFAIQLITDQRFRRDVINHSIHKQ